jgi:hypothetical protein
MTNLMNRFKRFILETPIGRLLMIPLRAWIAIRSVLRPLKFIPGWLLRRPIIIGLVDLRS